MIPAQNSDPCGVCPAIRSPMYGVFVICIKTKKNLKVTLSLLIETNLIVDDRDVVETLHPDGAGLPKVGHPAAVQQVVTDQQAFHRLVLRLGVQAARPVQISGHTEMLNSSLSVIFRHIDWFPHYAMSPDV